MNICLVTRFKFADIGGIPTHIYKLSNYYIKKGHNVFVINTNWYGDSNKFYEEVENVKIFNYPINVKSIPIMKNINNILRSEIGIKKLNKKYDFDIIHTHESGQSITHDVITSHACYKGYIDAINSLKNKSIYGKLYKFKKLMTPLNRCILEIEKYNYKHSKKIIAVSSIIKRQIICCSGIPKENVVVIPNGVDYNKFRLDKKKREVLRKKYKIDEGENVILFVGNDFKKKGLEYLIKSLTLIKRKKNKVVVVGKDDPSFYRKLAKKLGIVDKIIFAGFAKNIADYYSMADIFVFPTIYDSFGMVALEAMANSKPVIISKSAGASEIIEGENKILILENPTNHKEIAEKINILLEDEKIKKRVSKNAIRIAKKYDWKRIAEKTLKVYEEVLSK